MAEYLKYKYLVGTPSSNYLKIIYGHKTSLIYTYIPNYDIDKNKKAPYQIAYWLRTLNESTNVVFK